MIDRFEAACYGAPQKEYRAPSWHFSQYTMQQIKAAGFLRPVPERSGSGEDALGHYMVLQPFPGASANANTMF
jgi:hypothetical protein